MPGYSPARVPAAVYQREVQHVAWCRSTAGRRGRPGNGLLLRLLRGVAPRPTAKIRGCLHPRRDKLSLRTAAISGRDGGRLPAHGREVRSRSLGMPVDGVGQYKPPVAVQRGGAEEFRSSPSFALSSIGKGGMMEQQRLPKFDYYL